MNKQPVINNIISTFGIGTKKATDTFKSCGLNINKNPNMLKIKQQTEINKILNKLTTGKKLINQNKEIFQFLFKIKTYRGVRHKLKYPARGQRTHTNAKTKKKFKS